jgi:AcrR family transcriptional regulator
MSATAPLNLQDMERTTAATPLRRQLMNGRPPAALDAFKLARRKFQAGERIEVSALAQELSVNRVTLYRWAGTREALLVEIIWSLTEPTLTLEYERAPGNGGARIAHALTRFIQDTLDHPGMHRFLEEEGEYAMRLLTSARAGYQPRFIGAIQEMLEQETTAGNLELPVDLHDLAYVIVRLIESYVYTKHITGERPDPARAQPILELLLAGHQAAKRQ